MEKIFQNIILLFQNKMDNLAFEEKLGKEKSVIEYDERRIVIYF